MSEKVDSIRAIKERKQIPRKKVYTISKREIAHRASCSPTSLHNRNFSEGFEKTLTEMNEELFRNKEIRVAQLNKVGMKDRRKSEIVDEVRELRQELEKVENRKVKSMVDEIFDRLPLKSRRALNLE